MAGDHTMNLSIHPQIYRDVNLGRPDWTGDLTIIAGQTAFPMRVLVFIRVFIRRGTYAIYKKSDLPTRDNII